MLQRFATASARSVAVGRCMLELSNIFVAVEASDGGMRDAKGLPAAACHSWLSHMPRGRAAFFSDRGGDSPGPCALAGVTNQACCPGNASLGASITTAQYKREHVHLQLAHLLLDNSKYDGVRWLVSTEQDAWFNVPVLLDYLRHVEANLGSRGHEQPLSVGHRSLGPFLVFNVAALRRVFGNGTFMDACRAHLLECLRPRSMSASGAERSGGSGGGAEGPREGSEEDGGVRVDPEACHGRDECHAVTCTTARRLAPFRKAGSLCARPARRCTPARRASAVTPLCLHNSACSRAQTTTTICSITACS